MNHPLSFPKSARIVKSDDFTVIIRHGEYAADDVLVVNVRWALGAQNSPAKLGISIPKKTGNAVVRNRWKRWIRESFRTQREGLPHGVELIVRPKRDAQGSFATVDKSIRNTVTRAVRKLKKAFEP